MKRKWLAILAAALLCVSLMGCQERDALPRDDEEDSASTAQPESDEDDDEDGEIILPDEPESEDSEPVSEIIAPPAPSAPASSASQGAGGGASTTAPAAESPYLAPIKALLASYGDGSLTTGTDYAALPSGQTLPKVSSASDFTIANQADWGTGGSIYEFIATIPMGNSMVMCVGLNKLDGKWTAVGADFIALA